MEAAALVSTPVPHTSAPFLPLHAGFAAHFIRIPSIMCEIGSRSLGTPKFL